MNISREAETHNDVCSTSHKLRLPDPDISAEFLTTQPTEVRFPKVLLVTDIPPCKNLTAGLALHQLCSFLPSNNLACFSVINPHIRVFLDEDFKDIPHLRTEKPKEHFHRHFPGRLGAFESFCHETYTTLVPLKRLAKRIVQFSDMVGAEKIWCVLQGQTMIRLASQIVDLTAKPLLTQVWDPPEWWLRANNVDGWSQKLILNAFQKALARSEACAAASWEMAKEYCKHYDCNAIPVVPGLDRKMAMSPAKKINYGDTLIISMAGQFYAESEWNCLLSTLDSIDWRINEKQVVVQMLGRSFTTDCDRPRNMEYLGWRSQEETIKLLSKADILYCPYWFNPQFEKEARQSFPSKLTSYLAAGRPILFHGPEYASPAQFLKSHQAGIFCHSYSCIDIYNSIHKLSFDEDLYREIAHNGTKAFYENLTSDCTKAQFYRFLGA